MFAPTEIDVDLHYLFQYRALTWALSPILRLSDDILYLIFLEVKRSEMVYRSPKAIPALSHVCRFFRKIVLEAPLLWCDVYMHCLRTPQNHSWVVAHMRRSEDCMIDLHLFVTRKLSDDEIHYMFKERGGRIRSLTLRSSNSSLSRILWQQLHDTMPALQNFDYAASGDIVLHATRELPQEPFPFPLPFVFSNLTFSWAEWNAVDLTTLVLKWIHPTDRLPLEDLRIIFSICRDTLRYFEYVGISPYSEPDAPVEPITLPVLETLTLAYADSLVPLTKLMHVPNLKSFSIRDLFHSPDYERPFPWNLPFATTDVVTILELLYNVQLREFAISGERYMQSSVAFNAFLLRQRNLESLSIYGCSRIYHKAVFDWSVDAKDMLPVLSHLSIVYTSDIANQALSFLGGRVDSKLAPLNKLTLARNSQTFLLHEQQFFVEVARTISVVSDPVLQLHIPLDEMTIIAHGTLAFTPTPLSSPILA